MIYFVTAGTMCKKFLHKLLSPLHELHISRVSYVMPVCKMLSLKTTVSNSFHLKVKLPVAVGNPFFVIRILTFLF